VMGAGGIWWTPGFDNRDYNRAWHANGYRWDIFYYDNVNGVTCPASGTTNPTRCEVNGSYKESDCANVSDNSGVTWSCNSTHGFTHGLPASTERSATHAESIDSRLVFQAGLGVLSAPAQDALELFDRRRTSADRLPAALRSDLHELTKAPPGVPPAVEPGAPDPSQSRALLTGLGSRSETLYAVPTDKGGVCIALTAHGSLGCVDRFSETVPYGWEVRDPDMLGSGQSTIVAGLAHESVVSVLVWNDGRAEPATFGNGGFFYELDRTSDWPDRIEFLHKRQAPDIVELQAPGIAAKN